MTVMRNIDDTYDDVVDTADAEYEWGGHADDGTAVGYADVDDYAGDGDGNGQCDDDDDEYDDANHGYYEDGDGDGQYGDGHDECDEGGYWGVRGEDDEYDDTDADVW